MNQPTLQEYNLNANDVRKMLGYANTKYVRDLARFGKIPAIKVGMFWKFNEQQILQHIADETAKAIKKK